VAAAAIVGGTTAYVGGGKFANGAVTAAFGRLFNDEQNSKKVGDFVEVTDPITGKRIMVHRDYANDNLLKSGKNDGNVSLNAEVSAHFMPVGAKAGVGFSVDVVDPNACVQGTFCETFGVGMHLTGGFSAGAGVTPLKSGLNYYGGVFAVRGTSSIELLNNGFSRGVVNLYGGGASAGSMGCYTYSICINN
jgi:hypothetical protein